MKNIKHVTKDGLKILRMVSKHGGKIYYTRQWYLRLWSERGKKALYYPLGRNIKEAAALADKIDGGARSGEWTPEELKKRFHYGRKRPDVGHYSSLADLLLALREGYPLLNISESTANGYANSLAKIVREVLAADEKTHKTDSNIEAVSCQVLTVTTLNEFKSLRHKAAEELDDELKRVSALRSANKDVRQAKAIFSDEALEIFKGKGIRLPDMTAWKNVVQFGDVAVHYHLPEVGLIASVMGKIRQLTPGSEVWLATHLAAQFGLRREEIISCRWSWFKPGAVARVHIVRESDFVPKKGHERHVEIQPWAFNAIKAFQKSGSVYVLNGNAAERKKTVDKTTIALLRDAGIVAQKPLHELRKWFGSWTTAQRGLTFAQRQLGHDSYATTESHYGDVHFPEELDIWWEDGTREGQSPSTE